MLEALRFWGAGEGQVCVDEPVVLGHVADAAPVPHARERQPLSLPGAADVMLTADVRLDDPESLRRELGLQEAASSDAELVLQVYLRWGEECVRRLYGAFAFAVWDARRGVLFCARDHIGLRPFHFWEGRDAFVFATGAETVLAHPAVPRRADETALAARLVEHSGVLLERSFWADVRKLPPGHALVLRPGTPSRLSEYWRPEEISRQSRASPKAHAEALRDGLALAARNAVRGDQRVGTHLSGGLDSAAVAVFAQRALARDGRTLEHAFSWSPTPRDQLARDDERRRIERLAEALGTSVTYCDLSLEALRADLQREASLEPNEMRLYEDHVAAAAARLGVGVVLSGWGGDEVASFNGRGRLAWLMRTGRLRTLLRETAAAPRRHGVGPLRTARWTAAAIAYHALPPLLPEPLAHALHLARRPEANEALMAEARELHPDVPRLMLDGVNRLRTRPDPDATRLALLRNGHLTVRVEAWAYAGARAGVAYRYPLLDRRLLELCLSFPASLWRLNGNGRWLFHEAIAPVLPLSLGTEAKAEPARYGSYARLIEDAPSPPVSAASSPGARFAYQGRRYVKRLMREFGGG